MPSQEDIKTQQELLVAYRRNLAFFLKQQAIHGEAFTPPAVAYGVREARENILRIKKILRGWNIAIEDLPDDDEANDHILVNTTIHKSPKQEYLEGIREINNHNRAKSKYPFKTVQRKTSDSDITKKESPTKSRTPIFIAVLLGIIVFTLLIVYRTSLLIIITRDPATLTQIGYALLSSGEYESALSAFERASKTSSDSPELYHGLGQAYLKLGQIDAAFTAEERSLVLRNGAYPEALVGLGDIALLRGQPDQAVQKYSVALSQNTKLAGAYLGLGRAAAAQGNWSIAQAHFSEAIAVDPSIAEAHLWLGEAFIRLTKPQEAINEFSHTLNLKSKYPEAYYGLAEAQVQMGQNDSAMVNLDSALKLQPDYPEALLLQGNIYQQQGRNDAAIDAYSRSIDSGGKLAEPYYRRALLYMTGQRLDDTARDLEKAIDIQPNFPEAHYWLGRAYLAQNRPRPARDQLALAAEQRGENYPDALFYQGVAEEQLGMRSDAISSYQAALSQDSNGEWAGQARIALDRLKQP